MTRRRDRNHAKKPKESRRVKAGDGRGPKLDREIGKEIEVGRRFMKEYKEVFEKLADSCTGL